MLHRTKKVALTVGVLGITTTGVAVAATGDPFREGARNGTATRETQIIANLPATNTPTGGYATRQSNLSNSGGGAVYGCRSTAGGTAATPPKNPCIRVNNLANGFAFEFNASSGDSAGLITVGNGGDSKKPFTTNATGVATGLNADQVDGASADQIVTTAVTAARAKDNLDADTVDGASASGLRTRWLLINEAGQIEEQSGGFAILDAYTTNANVYIDAGSPLTGKGLNASVALQNKIDQTADGTADPNFTGLVSVARCQTVAVECAPANAKNTSAFVIAPRNVDGSATTGTTRKRVYVTITE